MCFHADYNGRKMHSAPRLHNQKYLHTVVGLNLSISIGNHKLIIHYGSKDLNVSNTNHAWKDVLQYSFIGW
jgi:hypothetical protein